MSSILKALKKLEEEKQASAKPAVSVTDSPVVTENRRSNGLLILITGVLAGALIVTLVVLWKSDRAPTPGQHAGAVQEKAHPAAVAQQEPNPVSPTSAPTNGSSGPVASAQLAKATSQGSKAQTLSSEQMSPPIQKTETLSLAERTDQPDEVVEEIRVSRRDVVEVSPARLVTKQLPGNANLIVSDIFYQGSSAESMAVINGLPVMEGTVIEKATVSRIFADRVEIELDGTTYEIGLGKRPR